MENAHRVSWWRASKYHIVLEFIAHYSKFVIAGRFFKKVFTNAYNNTKTKTDL